MGTLNVHSLSYRFPGSREPVLREVTLEISDHEVFGLLGPNGAGKTTMISVLAGQLVGATGRVAVDGEPLDTVRRGRPRSLGLVPQECAFYPMLTCLENLRFFGGVQGLRGAVLRQRVESVAGLARIEGVLARRAGQLSGGLKRRLNLAIGLLTEPELLLLDEPTVGVDPQSRAFLLECIRALAGANRFILYTSHYMDEVQAICDRVAIIDDGRVLVSGRLSEVLEDVSGTLTLQLRAPLPETVAAEWRTRYALREEGLARYRLRVGSAAGTAEVIERAHAGGCEVVAIDYGQRDLEQVFLNLTHRTLRD